MRNRTARAANYKRAAHFKTSTENPQAKAITACTTSGVLETASVPFLRRLADLNKDACAKETSEVFWQALETGRLPSLNDSQNSRYGSKGDMLTRHAAGDYCGLTSETLWKECPIPPVLGSDGILRYERRQLDKWMLSLGHGRGGFAGAGGV